AVGAAQPFDHRERITDTPEHADIGPGAKARWFGGADHQSLGGILLEGGENVVEFFEDLLIQGVDPRSPPVEQQPGDTLLIAGEAPVLPGARRLVAGWPQFQARAVRKDIDDHLYRLQQHGAALAAA